MLGAGCPTGEVLGFDKPRRGRGKRDLASRSYVLYNTERECKLGLVVVAATVMSFDDPWTILIDSGASSNYVRHCSLEGSQQYAEALKAQSNETITVCLETGTCVTVLKVSINLGVKF